jgi:hypothetical protein
MSAEIIIGAVGAVASLAAGLARMIAFSGEKLRGRNGHRAAWSEHD